MQARIQKEKEEHAQYARLQRQTSAGRLLSTVFSMSKPVRDIWNEATIRVPEDAPQDIVDLIKACRKHDPRQRPGIEKICDFFDNMEAGYWQGEMKP